MKRRWTESDLQEALKRGLKISSHSAVPAADAKPNSCNEPSPKNARQEAHKRVRLHYHSRRWRLIDADGLHSKWATDGLVLGGLLPDDGPAFVESVTYSQEKIPAHEQEETIISVVEIE